MLVGIFLIVALLIVFLLSERGRMTLTAWELFWAIVCLLFVSCIFLADLLDGVFDIPGNIVSVVSCGGAVFSLLMAGGVSPLTSALLGVIFSLVALAVSVLIRVYADSEAVPVSVSVGDKGVVKGTYHQGDKCYGDAVFEVNGIKAVRHIIIEGIGENDELPKAGEVVIATKIEERVVTRLDTIENITKERG